MTREFIMLPEFEKQWETMGLGDLELKLLQEELTLSPKKGEVIQGTGGLRKLRFSFENRGKSGSARVCYVDFAMLEKTYLITAYSKNKKEDLSKKECKAIHQLIQILEKSAKEQKL